MLDKSLFKLIGKDKRKLIYIVICQTLGLLITLICSLILVFVLYELIENLNFSALYYLLLVIALVLTKFYLNSVINKFQNDISEKVEISLREKLVEEILDDNKVTHKYKTEALNQLCVEGIEQLGLYYIVYIPSFFYALISPIIMFIFYSFLSIYVALIFLIFVPLIPLSIILVSKFAKRIFNKYWDIYLSMGDDFLDSIKGLKELKTFNSTDDQLNKIDLKAEEFRKITMKVLVMQLYSTSIMDLCAFGGLAIGLSSALFFLNGNLINNAYYVLIFILTGLEFFMPLRSLGSAFHLSMNGATAGRKILDILSEEKEVTKNIDIESIKSIDFKDVSISFDEKVVIDKLNLLINSNGLYGICGESGKGKSTILKSLISEIKPNKGEILFNNIDLNEINRTSLFKIISYLSYDSHVFKGTILDNFLIVNKSISQAKMKEYLSMVKLDHLDLNYEIEENATNLSGGEKQRLMLAFYISRSSQVYIFDEVTSNIDYESELTIINCIKKLAKNSIVIMISHRLENLIEAKTICYISDKNLEISNHEELFNNSKSYRELYLLQLKMKGEAIYE